MLTLHGKPYIVHLIYFRHTMTKKTVTSYDVAKLAGVSQSSVSRAFARDKSISKKNQEKILKAAKELNYRVNYTAQSLSSPKSRLVGVVVSHLDNPLRALQTRLITERLVKKHYHPILLSIDDPETLEELLEDLLGYNLSGIIITSGRVPTKIIDECHGLNIPMVTMYHDTALTGVDHIGLDIAHAGQLAFDMLHSCKAHSMAVVKIDDFSYTIGARAEQFIQVCKDNHTPCHIFNSDGNTYQDGKKLSYTVYQQLNTIDGIFCSNDAIAMGIMDGLKQFGVSIPNDIQILGFDDIPMAEWGGYNLSTIHLQTQQPAIQAVDMLIHRIENPKTEYKTYFATLTPIFRKTTGTP